MKDYIDEPLDVFLTFMNDRICANPNTFGVLGIDPTNKVHMDHLYSMWELMWHRNNYAKLLEAETKREKKNEKTEENNMEKWEFADDLEAKSTDDFWYDFFDGGYIKPEDFLADGEQVLRVQEARSLLESFQAALYDNDLMEEM